LIPVFANSRYCGNSVRDKGPFRRAFFCFLFSHHTVFEELTIKPVPLFSGMAVPLIATSASR
jgi:hypothetical protein